MSVIGPERTCVACGRKRPKNDLIRVCRGRGAPASVDQGGKTPGRGCYVCPDKTCIRAAANEGRISRALSVGVDDSVIEELERIATRNFEAMEGG